MNVAVVPQCEECRQVWLPGDADRWHAFRIDDDANDRLVFYCPSCAEREFGRDDD
jgi:RNase P subunit RPR2